MEEIVELGTDFNSNWDFKDGDLILVENKDNLIQAILNRLNCQLDNLDLFYFEYGSVLCNFFGWKHDDETLEFIRLEVENTLSQEPRIVDSNVEVSYNEDGRILIDLYILYSEDSDLTLSIVLEKDGELVADRE